MDAFGFFEDSSPQKTRLHRRIKRYVRREIDNDNLFEKQEETFFDENGPSTEETNTVYKADCGHMMGLFDTGQEFIAECAKCGKQLCHRCGNLRCSRCLDILCSTCAKLVGDRVYCSKCRIIHCFKFLSFFSLKGLHEILSKEIR